MKKYLLVIMNLALLAVASTAFGRPTVMIGCQTDANRINRDMLWMIDWNREPNDQGLYLPFNGEESEFRRDR